MGYEYVRKENFRNHTLLNIACLLVVSVGIVEYLEERFEFHDFVSRFIRKTPQFLVHVSNEILETLLLVGINALLSFIPLYASISQYILGEFGIGGIPIALDGALLLCEFRLSLLVSPFHECAVFIVMLIVDMERLEFLQNQTLYLVESDLEVVELRLLVLTTVADLVWLDDILEGRLRISLLELGELTHETFLVGEVKTQVRTVGRLDKLFLEGHDLGMLVLSLLLTHVRAVPVVSLDEDRMFLFGNHRDIIGILFTQIDLKVAVLENTVVERVFP